MQAYHFIRALLAPNQAWAAFDWQTFPAATDLDTLIGAADLCAPLARQRPLWVSCRSEWLARPELREFIKKLGHDQVILAFPAGTSAIREQNSACQQLRKDGIHVALAIEDSAVLKTLTVTSFDHLLFNIDHARNGVPLIDLINAHQYGYQLVASGVATHEQFDWAVAKRFSLLSSEFVATVDERAPIDADTTRLKLLKLLSLVVQDADTREIEEIFRQEPKLSYNLLRLVNSVAVGPKTPITGFNQAITVLGRRQLQRWLQLLIYANQFGHAGQPNPLMQLAAARGKMMEILASVLEPIPEIDDIREAAFMTGIFSLLDTLLHLPMADVLAALPLAAPIAEALGKRTGQLGILLGAVAESGNEASEQTTETLAKLNIDPALHLTAQIDAYTWASKITLE